MEDIKIKGILAKDTTDWKNSFEKEVNKFGCGVMWKDQMSNLEEIKESLRKLISEQGYFDYYNIANNISDYHGKIVDFATKEDYPSKVQEWKEKNPAWFCESFDEYAADNQKAVIAFLVEDFERIPTENQIPFTCFKFYKKQPSVKNAVAYIDILSKGSIKQQTMTDKIKQLLISNHNLILTGAPGTGKTYLAKQIAQQMIFGEVKEKMTDEEKKQFDEQYGFVQFHPSYDYTDFVEGLRPKQEDNRNIGFERKDGIFKEFCKRAIGGKTREIIAEEVSAGEVQNVYRWYADTDDSDFGRIYKSLLKDVAAGKLNGLNFGGSYYRLGISRTGKLCIPDESIDRTINEGTLKRLYDHLAKDNWKNLDESSSYYFRIAKKTLNYTHYRAVLQEMKNRKEKEGDLLGDKVVTSEHTLSSNPVDSDSSVDTSIPAKENDIDEAMKSFKDYVKEAGEKGVTINYLNSTGDFKVYMGDNDSLRVKIANGNTHHTSPMNIKKYITTKDADDDTYDSSIGQYIIDHYMNDAGNEDSDEEENPIVSDNTGNKPFVFVIDEINRGEISKIFGELFFSIDPGYRGEKGIVQTQYQNMVEGGDAFKKGFFVPENVYIIGTMNDIDRSVESMDFAFRRRFAFKEIKADENVGMLDGLKWKDEAIERMKRLNKAISDTEGLSSAYHIGASYFLKLKNYDGDFSQLWEYHLDGLLREYLRGMQNVYDSIKKLKEAYDKSNNTSTDGSDSNN